MVDERSIKRVAKLALLKQGFQKTAGEVRFVKDKGPQEWGWQSGPDQRVFDPQYKFDTKNLKPLAQCLRSALAALGHVQSAYNTFTKLKSRNVSPDGSLGGRGYIMKITDMRRQFMNCSEALSALSDTIYDEIHAPHWSADSNVDVRDRHQVKQILDDAQEIRDNPEEWAEEEEAEMDAEHQDEEG